jgi:hypothetical protein
MTPRDLPWSPLAGQTALRVISSNAERVLCADKTRAEIRTLWTADGRLLAVSGPSLTLDGIATKPAPTPSPIIFAAVETFDAAEAATLEALERAPADCLTIAREIEREADKTFLALLALSRRGHAVTGPTDGAKPRAWSLTTSGAAALRVLRAAPRAAAPIATPTAQACAPAPLSQPTQMSLF